MPLLRILLVFSFISTLHAQPAPYPKSDLITSIKWDKNAIVTFGKGSDQWPMTWAADNNVYTAWGDGFGWAEKGKKHSIGITRISGTPPKLKGEDLWGDGPGHGFAKPEALIALGDSLYMFWTNSESRDDDHNTSVATSVDSGKTWSLNQQPAFPNLPNGFRVRGICQFGPGNANAPDGNVYIYFGFSRQPEIYLARTPTRKLFDPSYYTWFQKSKPNGDANWTAHFSEKQPVFTDPNAYLWHIGVSHNPGLNRYILSKPHYAPNDNPTATAAKDSGMAALGIFDAPKPWGPWTTVFHQDNFIDEHVKFSYYIMPKFISQDGKTFWMAWSGWPEYDSVSFIKGQFILK